MTNPWPLYLQNKVYPASFDRQLLDDIFGAGVTSPEGMVVLPSISTRGVDITLGIVYVQGDESPLANDQGSYRCLNPDVTSLAIDSCSTFPRIDQVIARVYDGSYSGTRNEWALEIFKGVETSGADLTNLNGMSFPLPHNSFALGRVLAPVGSGLVADVSDTRQLAGSSPTLRVFDIDMLSTHVANLNNDGDVHVWMENGSTVKMSGSLSIDTSFINTSTGSQPLFTLGPQFWPLNKTFAQLPHISTMGFSSERIAALVTIGATGQVSVSQTPADLSILYLDSVFYDVFR